MFTHQGQKLLVLDSFCRTINQYDVKYNNDIHLDNQNKILEAAQKKATQPLSGTLNQIVKTE